MNTKKSAITDANKIKVFPNPTNDKISIIQNISGTYNLVISDALGRLIYTSTFNGSACEVECKNFATGIYFVNVYNNENMFNCKIIKQ